MAPKTIKVDYLARVEGEGSLTLRFDGKKAKSVELSIFEPPRFFEAFLRGRSQLEVPDITARICGICPVAYQMSSCQAVENGLNVKVPDELGDLRRVLYCGEWLESHLLHIFMLHAPDFLGFEDAMQMARANPDYAQWVRLGLRLKKAGNKIVSFLGGREIHPINVRVGGFYRIPPKKESFPLIEELKECRKLSEKALHWLAGFTFPEFERDYEFVALHHADEYAITRGEIISNRGVNIKIKDYDRVFEERQVAHSNALHSQIIDRGSYFCGPLARVNLNFDQLPQNIKDLAKAIGFQVPCQNPFKSILARGLEVCLAFQEVVRILENLAWPQEAYTEIPVKKAIGYGATEAPRGLLYHRYHLNKDGLIEDAKIVPPTSQNQSIIEEDLFEMAPQLAELKHSELTWRAEQAIRNYDPCISCATHFLKLKIEND